MQFIQILKGKKMIDINNLKKGMEIITAHGMTGEIQYFMSQTWDSLSDNKKMVEARISIHMDNGWITYHHYRRDGVSHQSGSADIIGYRSSPSEKWNMGSIPCKKKELS